MNEADSTGPEVKKIALYESILREIPEESPFYLEEYTFPAPALKVQTFDELYQLRKDLQAFRILFSRHPLVQQSYKEMQELLAKTAFNGDTIFDALVRHTLAQLPVTLDDTQFPYDLPEGTLHRILWYRTDVTKEQKAEYLADIFFDEGVENRDFIIVSSLPSRRTVPQFAHEHVLIRLKDGYNLLLPRLPDW